MTDANGQGIQAITPWITFDHDVVFLSASRDMDAEIEVCRRVVEELSKELGVADGLKPYSWKYADHAWAADESWQHQIPRSSDPKVRAVVCLFGERVGEPLPGAFRPPQERHFPEWVIHPWPERGVAGAVPLTGTLFEYLDSVVDSHREGESKNRKTLVYVKANAQSFHREGAASEDRGYGFEHYQQRLIKDRAFNRAGQHTYHEQIDWLDLFCEKSFRSNERAYGLFGAESREESLEQLRSRLREDLGRILGVTPRRIRREPKGLLAYQPEDWDILFGRNDEIEDILDRLSDWSRRPNALPIIHLTGQSGQGKSSVLRAGIVGRIRHGKRYSSYGKFRPVLVDASQFGGRDPLLDLAEAIEAQAEIRVSSSVPKLDQIALDTRGEELARRVRAGLPDGERLLVAVDQAEMLPILAENDREAHPGEFIKTLVGLASSGQAWGVLTVPLEHEGATAALFSADNVRIAPPYWLGDPDRHALERIVHEAFAQAWVPLDAALVLGIVTQADD